MGCLDGGLERTLHGRVALVDDGRGFLAAAHVVVIAAEAVEVLELVQETVVDQHSLVQRWVAGGTELLSGIAKDAENSIHCLEKLPVLGTQLGEITLGLGHLGQRGAELEGALDHGMRGVPAGAHVEKDLLARCATHDTLSLELFSTLGRAADLGHQKTQLGDAWQVV
jgi:hypothetical protein